ncbi:unnamed protein product, partial [Larinioides sclopetarius]
KQVLSQVPLSRRGAVTCSANKEKKSPNIEQLCHLATSAETEPWENNFPSRWSPSTHYFTISAVATTVIHYRESHYLLLSDCMTTSMPCSYSMQLSCGIT